MKPDLEWDYRKPRRAITIRLVLGIWLILLTVISCPKATVAGRYFPARELSRTSGWPGSPIGEFLRN